MGALEGLEPKKVFQFFEEISAIPRGSGNIKAISDYLAGFAKERELDYIQDEAGNVMIRKEASKGYEASDPVMIQGHMDMVCEKDSQTRHDFTKDPLPLAYMDDTVFARGTTLGADDGIAIAYALAILDSPEIEHPPLECLFTTDEETGMEGAKAFDYSVLKARRVINLDSEDEGIFFNSCAGGMRGSLTLPVKWSLHKGVKYKIVISGLLGGHSGETINQYRANAILLMGRLLVEMDKKLEYRIASLQGGLMDNAIPREASLHVHIREQDIRVLEELVRDFEKKVRNEYRANENNLMIYCENRGEAEEEVVKQKRQEKMVFMLNMVPNGVQKMCMEKGQENLVQTSLNFGIMRLSEEEFTIEAALRSSISSEKHALSEKLRLLAESLGGSYKERGDYPAWEYNGDSVMMPKLVETYQKLFGKEPVVKGIHAGLECGIIYEAMKPVDIVSFGPQINGAHTPHENLSVPSAGRMWELLLEFLKALK